MPQVPLNKEGEKVLVAFGSNQAPDVEQTRAIVEDALKALADRYRVDAISKLYKTPCFPEGSGPDFVNGACVIHTDASPKLLLGGLHRIEAEFGRTRERRWGKRTLDLDLIAYGELVAPDVATHKHWRDLPLEEQMTVAPDRLILPHPRVQDRSFVLVPLADIAPDWVHPILGQTVTNMLAQRPSHERTQIAAI